MGFGRRAHDHIPYRALGPVTIEAHESRRERYDEQLVRKYEVAITGKSAVKKVALLRRFRQQQYEKLQDAVYIRRRWTQAGIPSVETVKRSGSDFP
jgi:aldehyde:ferredoxin oxidoreductase